MSTIAVQCKQRDKAAKTAAPLTPETRELGMEDRRPAAGVPLFLHGGLQSSTSGVLVQAKLTVGPPDDAYEQEADRVGEAAASPPSAAESIAASNKHGDVPSWETSVNLPGGEGSPLSDQVRRRVEPLVGANLADVRVHTGLEATRAADASSARAFTHQKHIWLGRNESPDDTELMAHEAAHVVQQSVGTHPGGTPEGAPAIQRLHVDSSPISVETPTVAATPVVSSRDDGMRTVRPDILSKSGSVTSCKREAERNLIGEGTGASSRASDGGGRAEKSDGTSEGEGRGDAEGIRPGENGVAQVDTNGVAGGEAASTEEDIGGAAITPPAPETGAGDLGTDDLVLIDLELAEHERWAGSFGEIGTAGSDQRTRFLLDQAGQGAVSGAAGGAGMGFLMGAIGAGFGQIAGRRLATLAVSRGASVAPIPGLGPAIGGVMAVAGLAMRDWGASAETISRMGTGEGYEGLANDLEAIAEVLDIATQVMDVLAGVLGGIAVGMWVATVLSAGVLSPLALTLSAIATGITIATTAIGVIINAVIRPSVTALRALHTFESRGDPAQIEAECQQLQAAAGQVTGAVAGAIAGRAGGHVGARGGTRADLSISGLQARRTGGRPSMSAAAGPGPRLHVEVPEAPTRAGPATKTGPHGAPNASAPTTARPAATGGPAAASPGSISQGSRPIRMDVLADLAEAKRLSSGSTLAQVEYGTIPGPPGRHLRLGERDPGNYTIPPSVRSDLAKSSRAEGMANLGEAVQGGIDTPRTAASRETLDSDTLIALTDPTVRRENPHFAEQRSNRTDLAIEADQSVQASHVPGVATEPHHAHTGENVEIIPTEAHLQGIHQGDTTRTLETAFPNPDYQGSVGFQNMSERATPAMRSDRGLLLTSERESAHWEQRFPGATQTKIEEGRQWLAQNRGLLQKSGQSNLETPSTSPSASSPIARSSGDTGAGPATNPAYASNTQTMRTPDRAAAVVRYHEQIRSDPTRESGVWRDAEGNFYVMQGDQSSVAPPPVAGPLELIYHSHPTEIGAARQGLVSQPSQAGGDIGVLQYQHGQGPAGHRQSSELHFPAYDASGAHVGYGATRFAYDPTHPLPLQVETTLPGGRTSRHRYRSFADFEQRRGIGAGGTTPAESAATRTAADVHLRQDITAARQRIGTIVEGTQTRQIGLPGMREGREFGRQRVQGREQAGESAPRPAYGPAYTASVPGLEPGESVEIPINPAYPEPPGTVAELEALREQMRVSQEVQGELAGTERRMAAQADQQRTHGTQLIEAQGVTEDLGAGRADHQASVDSTQSTNAEQQSTAENAISTLGRSAQEATALATLVASLRLFQGMAHLFSYLPGDLGRRAERARDDAGGLITSLNRVSETDAVQSSVEGGQREMVTNEQRIEAVTAEGQQTDMELTTGQQQIIELESANAASLAETESVQQQAITERRDAAGSEEEAQAAHDDLRSRLEVWAQEHRQARLAAIADARSHLSLLGYEVSEE